MKKTIFLFLSLFMIGQSTFSLTVNCTSGGLATAVGSALNTTTNLTITGSIDSRDFGTMNNMTALAIIDLSGVSITAYSSYPANTIPLQAFSNKFSLTTLTLSTSVTAIGNYAFSNCQNLKLFTLLASITSIGDGAFTSCINLTNTTIPSSVTFLGAEAFSSCNALTGPLVIPAGITSIGINTFKECFALKSVLIPSSVITIGEKAFYRCEAITSMDIPFSVKSIGASAFYFCYRMTSVTIPSSVLSIGNQAFYSCIGLTSIYSYPVIPVDLVSIYTAVFTSVNTNSCTLYVPIGSKAAYQVAVQWKDFKNIVETTTAVPNLFHSNLIVYTNMSAIIVEGSSVGEILSVYSQNGLKLQSIKSKGERLSIPVTFKGVYFVKTQNEVVKVVI